MRKQQVIVIMTDSQRWDMLSCARDTGLQTPSLDRLAGRGVRFERAYTAQPVCQPARAAIFTGQYPHSCGSWSNCMGLSQTTPTIGERLQYAGIRTAYIGKWHLDGGDYFGQGRCPKGWDAAYWYDMRNYLEDLTPQQRLLSRNQSSNRTETIAAAFTFGHRVADRAIGFISQNGDESALLCVSFDEPHDPYLCPRSFVKQYENYVFPKSKNIFDRLENKPDYQRLWSGDLWKEDKDILRLHSPDYFGCNAFVDWEIGRVLDAIDKYMPNATVIYTSDHGDMLYSHALWGKGPAVYDEITRIPFITAGPNIPKGAVSPHPVSHISITPTILDLFGLPIPDTLEGISLLPQMQQPTYHLNPYVFMEFGRYEVDHDAFGGFQPLRAVFDGRWKLSINLLSTDELYDVESDPEELQNRIYCSDCVEIRDKLHRVLLEHMNDTRDPFRGYCWEHRPWKTLPATPKSWDYTHMTRQRHEDEQREPRQLDYRTGLPVQQFTRPR